MQDHAIASPTAYRISTEGVSDFAALGREWRCLEDDSDPTFFRSWTWVGCLAQERFPDPVLLRATEGDRTVGLALFNRRGGQLCLGESGDPVLDAPFVEHNGPLLARGAAAAGAAILRAARALRGVRRLILGGVAPELVAAAGGTPFRLQERAAPYVDLESVRQAGGDVVPILGASTRAQIRRSLRHYAERGPIALERAVTPAEALAWLDALIALHDADWQSRGHAGAFATAFARRFHRSLVVEAEGRGELDLVRLTTGDDVVGYLYNLRLGGTVHAYQAGLDRAGAGRHGKPGLTCHALAIARAAAEGLRTYDLMAGSQRYKTNLSRNSIVLHWAEIVPRWSLPGMVARATRMTFKPSTASHTDLG